MLDYQNGKIHKIVCNVTGLVYIGSTCRTLQQRLANHVSNYNCYLNGTRRYIATSCKIFANDDNEIILIENYPCNSKTELLSRERYYTQLIPCVNISKNQGLVAEIGQKERNKIYQFQNKEKLSKQKRLYQQENKEHIKNYTF